MEERDKPVHHLYTVMLRCFSTKETFFDQITTYTINPKEVLAVWAHKAVTDGFIKGSEDAGVFLQDLEEDNEQLTSLDGVFNIWRIRFLLRKGFYIYSTLSFFDENLKARENIYCIVDFIKTGMEVVEAESLAEQRVPPTSGSLRLAQEKYKSYQEQYSKLKAAAKRTHELNKQRRRVEKQLQYWQAKLDFLVQMYNRDTTSKQKNIYTVILEQNSGISIRQPLIKGNDLKFALIFWANDIFQDKYPDYDARIIESTDRTIIAQKLSQDIYGPVPIENLKNVWATYLTLPQGLACITIIKTALDQKGLTINKEGGL